MRSSSSVAVLSLMFSVLSTAIHNTTDCANFQPNTTYIELPANVHFHATPVGVGKYTVTAADGSTSVNNVSFCQIIGNITYGAEGNNILNFELWLPGQSNYNGRYLSVGNGGFAGVIDYTAMLTNLESGYAVAGSDSGHTVAENGESEPGSFVEFLSNRDQTLAWIHNSIAMFTPAAKALTTTFYEQVPSKTYYSGCSTGGAQGFALARFHPEIFDGIYAGSPGNYYSHLVLSFLFNGLNSNTTEAFLDQAALNFTNAAVLEKCDTIDGVKDGILEDPIKCDFDITTLKCQGDQSPIDRNSTVCLTSSQITNAQSFHSGPKNSQTSAEVYPGFPHGSEIEWLLQETILYLEFAVPLLQNLVFQNLSFDYTKFNWDSNVKTVDEVASPLISEISPNFDAFKARGGKLLVTQGWADPFNSPFWPIQQRDEMLEVFGTAGLKDFYALFMIPAGGHCGTAPNYPQMPATYGTLDVLVPWVENGVTPSEMLAFDAPDGSNTTRKLCPFPENAVYVNGSIDNFNSYVCK